MKKFVSVLLFILIIITACANLASAHPGRTDSKGGHYNRSTGEYHYHHGMSAHQHPNGVCPYRNNETTTTRYYNSYSSSTNSYTTSSAYDSKYIEYLNEKHDETINIYNYIVGGLAVAFIISILILRSYAKEKKEKECELKESRSEVLKLSKKIDDLEYNQKALELRHKREIIKYEEELRETKSNCQDNQEYAIEQLMNIHYDVFGYDITEDINSRDAFSNHVDDIVDQIYKNLEIQKRSSTVSQSVLDSILTTFPQLHIEDYKVCPDGNWKYQVELEDFVRLQYIKKGYDVVLENQSIDSYLLANGLKNTLIIQCQYLPDNIQVNENFVFRLNSVKTDYCIDHVEDVKRIKAVLVTNSSLSERAKTAAVILKISYKEHLKFNK